MNTGISKRKKTILENKMSKLGILEKDITEKFVRSRGKGGQKVNKTSSCVYVKHQPTGIEVKCQQERSQDLNRFLARKILVKKVETLILGRLSEEKKRIEKIKRQKRKRSKRAKEKVLKFKAERKEKKQARSYRPVPEDIAGL